MIAHKDSGPDYTSAYLCARANGASESDMDDYLAAAEDAHNGSGPRPGPDPENPFTDPGDILLERLHALGREVYGKGDWLHVGPQLIHAVTGGRTSASRQLTHDEGLELVADLQAQASLRNGRKRKRQYRRPKQGQLF